MEEKIIKPHKHYLDDLECGYCLLTGLRVSNCPSDGGKVKIWYETHKLKIGSWTEERVVMV